MSLLLTCVLGPVFTTRALADYFGDGRTWEFLAKNATTLFGAKFNLPGVFEHNPCGARSTVRCGRCRSNCVATSRSRWRGGR
jgi:hypothetical protein